MSTLDVSVAAGESGPVLVLSGEADMMTVAQLSEALTAQISGGARQLTIDAAGLRFLDSASVRVLVLASRALKDRGGVLEVARPQPAVARVLNLAGANHVLKIRAATGAEPEP